MFIWILITHIITHILALNLHIIGHLIFVTHGSDMDSTWDGYWWPTPGFFLRSRLTRFVALVIYVHSRVTGHDLEVKVGPALVKGQTIDSPNGSKWLILDYFILKLSRNKRVLAVIDEIGNFHYQHTNTLLSILKNLGTSKKWRVKTIIAVLHLVNTDTVKLSSIPHGHAPVRMAALLGCAFHGDFRFCYTPGRGSEIPGCGRHQLSTAK